VTLVRRELAADGKPGRRTLAVDQCHEGESDHDDRVSESRGDIHGGVSGATQLSCREASQLGERRELSRRIGKGVKQHDCARRSRAMREKDRHAAGGRDVAVARDPTFIDWTNHSSGSFVRRACAPR
jgi:hypothetical protein